MIAVVRCPDCDWTVAVLDGVTTLTDDEGGIWCAKCANVRFVDGVPVVIQPSRGRMEIAE